MSAIRFVKDSRSTVLKFWVLTSFCMLSALALGQLCNTTSTPIPGVGLHYITDLNKTINPVNGAVSVTKAAPRPRDCGFNLALYACVYESNCQFQVTPSWAYSSYTNSQYVTSVNTIPGQFLGGGGMFCSNRELINGAQPGSGIPGTITQNLHTLNGYFGGGPSVGTYATSDYSGNYIYRRENGVRGRDTTIALQSGSLSKLSLPTSPSTRKRRPG